jgi:hypothetical protein
VSAGLRRLLQEALLDLDFGYPLEQVLADLCADLDRLTRRAERARARAGAPTVLLRLPQTATLPAVPTAADVDGWEALIYGTE